MIVWNFTASESQWKVRLKTKTTTKTVEGKRNATQECTTASASNSEDKKVIFHVLYLQWVWLSQYVPMCTLRCKNWMKRVFIWHAKCVDAVLLLLLLLWVRSRQVKWNKTDTLKSYVKWKRRLSLSVVQLMKTQQHHHQAQHTWRFHFSITTQKFCSTNWVKITIA